MSRIALALPLLLAAGLARAEAPAEAPAPAAAPPKEAPASPPNRRAINGHEFNPSGTVPAPLAVSSFTMADRLSYGSATGHRYDASGQPTPETRTYSFGGMVMGVGFQSAFGESFAVRGSFDVSLFTGTDGLSALVVGTTVQPGVTLGAEWSRPLGDAWRVGVSLDYQNAPQLNLLIMAGILHAIDTGTIDGSAAFEANNVTTWSPTLSAAWVPHPAVGLIGRLGYANSGLETDAMGTYRRQAITVGVAADVDLRRLWSTVPIGANLAYADSIPVGGSISGVRDLSLGLMYNGNATLALGGVLGVQELRIRPQYPDPLKSSSPYLTIVLKAYWP